MWERWPSGFICHDFLTELGGLLKYVRPFLNSISKAKAARLVRSLLDLFLDMEAATGQEVELCLECIDWAKAEKRTFLRQALEVTLWLHYKAVNISWPNLHVMYLAPNEHLSNSE